MQHESAGNLFFDLKKIILVSLKYGEAFGDMKDYLTSNINQIAPIQDYWYDDTDRSMNFKLNYHEKDDLVNIIRTMYGEYFLLMLTYPSHVRDIYLGNDEYGTIDHLTDNLNNIGNILHYAINCANVLDITPKDSEYKVIKFMLHN